MNWDGVSTCFDLSKIESLRRAHSSFSYAVHLSRWTPSWSCAVSSNQIRPGFRTGFAKHWKIRQNRTYRSALRDVELSTGQRRAVCQRCRMVLIVIWPSGRRSFHEILLHHQIWYSWVHDPVFQNIFHGVLFGHKILDQLLHHDRWNLRTIPRVLQNQRTRILPICLEPNLLCGPSFVDCCIQQCHSARVCSQIIDDHCIFVSDLQAHVIPTIGGLPSEVPEPLDRSGVRRRFTLELLHTVLSSGIQKSRSKGASFKKRSQPISSHEEFLKPTLGTMNLVPDLFLSTLVCQAMPNNPSSSISSSFGFTWRASSNRSDAKTMHSIHQTNNLAASGRVSIVTNTSIAPTTPIGIGTASRSVDALSLEILAWRAPNLWSSRSGSSITNLEHTHFTDVLKAGTTEGPQPWWSSEMAYFSRTSIDIG